MPWRCSNTTPADLWILDVGLPDMSGFEACKRLRKFSEVPVLFLTARNAEIDRVVGLEIGADDYVTKPFSPREVAARVKAILKRVQTRPLAVFETAQHGPFRLDLERVQIHYQQQLLVLTRHEFRLLQTLLGQPERVFSPRAIAGRRRGGQRRRLPAQHRQPYQEPARQTARRGAECRADPNPSRIGL